MGDAIMGICPYCNQNKQLERTYFYYDIDCECHVGKHFIIVDHCSDCVPKEPGLTKIIIKPSKLKRLDKPLRQHRSAIVKRKR